MPTMKRYATLSLGLLAALGACTDKGADEALVNGAGTNDPGFTSALGKQIVVDPKRTAAIAPQRLSRAPGLLRPECERLYRYDAGWARRLPAALPVYAKAKVSEAAGTDAPGCRMRIVSFTVAVPTETILYHYQQSAVRAGYSADRQTEASDVILAGTRGEEAYYIIVMPAAGGGAAVDLVANHGA